MRDVQLGQVYRHFKGDYYLVEALARDSETNEPCVIYRKLYGDGGLWVRPLDMFLSPVDREKYPDAGTDLSLRAPDDPQPGRALRNTPINTCKKDAGI
ncbi:MAG: DUF1653 domain-containing protein [Oscillospiraceae bacterium]